MGIPGRGLFLDEDGGWWHDGDPVTHVRLAALLHRCVASDGAGGMEVTTGRDRMAFTCADLPVRVLCARVEAGGTVTLTLSTGGEEPLDGASLGVDADHRWRCRVCSGLEARFTRAAQAALTEAVEEDGAGGFVLRLGGRAVALLASGR